MKKLILVGGTMGVGKKLGMQGTSSKADAVGMAGWGLVLEFKSL